MNNEYDFRGGERGRFYRPNHRVRLPRQHRLLEFGGLAVLWATICAIAVCCVPVDVPAPVDAWTDRDALLDALPPSQIATCSAGVVRGALYVDITIGVTCTGTAADTMAWVWDNIGGPIGIHREVIPCGGIITVRYPFDTTLLHDTHVAATPLVSGGSLCVGWQL